jgi:hypothetical protein
VKFKAANTRLTARDYSESVPFIKYDPESVTATGYNHEQVPATG